MFCSFDLGTAEPFKQAMTSRPSIFPPIIDRRHATCIQGIEALVLAVSSLCRVNDEVSAPDDELAKARKLKCRRKDGTMKEDTTARFCFCLAGNFHCWEHGLRNLGLVWATKGMWHELE